PHQRYALARAVGELHQLAIDVHNGAALVVTEVQRLQGKLYVQGTATRKERLANLPCLVKCRKNIPANQARPTGISHLLRMVFQEQFQVIVVEVFQRAVRRKEPLEIL